MSFRIRTGSASLQGLRSRNEDAVFAASTGGKAVLGVFDGLGGHRNGQEASAAARCKYPGLIGRVPWSDVYKVLNADVETTGGATTATTLALSASAASLAWCGDSPAMLIREGRVAFFATPHGYSNIVLRCLGGGRETPWTPEVHRFDVQAGDIWVLASDGLDVLLDDGEAESTARRIAGSIESYESLDKLCERIAQRAIDAGSEDNCTIAIAIVEACA